MQPSSPIIVWLDSNATDANNSFITKLKDGEHVETFSEVEPCIAYINSHSKEDIFFIVSGPFAMQIVSQIYDLSNILMIFVFCAPMKTYIDWAMDYSDKLLMFDHEHDLLQRLWTQFEECFREKAKQYITQADQCQKRVRQFNNHVDK